MTIRVFNIYKESIGLVGFLDPKSTIDQMQELKKELSRIYAEYLMEYKKDFVIDILTKNILFTDSFEESEHKFIFRPSCVVSCLTQNATLALRFTRFKNDEKSIEKFIEKLKERGISEQIL